MSAEYKALADKGLVGAAGASAGGGGGVDAWATNSVTMSSTAMPASYTNAALISR